MVFLGRPMQLPPEEAKKSWPCSFPSTAIFRASFYLAQTNAIQFGRHDRLEEAKGARILLISSIKD